MLKALPALVEKLNEYKQHFKNNVELNENIEVSGIAHSFYNSGWGGSRKKYVACKLKNINEKSLCQWYKK